MAALQRTIAFPQMDGVAVAVGQDLHLDVPGLLDVFFEINAAILEGLLRFLLGRLEPGLEADVVAGHAHAAAAAAGRRLDQHGIAHLLGQAHGLGLIGDQPVAAGHHGHAALLGESCGPRSCCRAGAWPPAGGPMNSILHDRHTSAKWAFSERKP